VRKSGIGTMTQKGNSMVLYCANNDVAVDFQYFYITETSDSLTNLTDPSCVSYNNVIEAEFENIMNAAGTTFYKGTANASSTFLSSGDSTILPVLCQTVASSVQHDILVKTLFLSAVDPESKKIVLTTDAYTTTAYDLFDHGEIVVGSTSGAQGTVEFIDINNATHMYVKSVSGTFQTGESVEGQTNLNTKVISSTADCSYLIYSGCISYDERLELSLTDATNFDAVTNNYITNNASTPALAQVIAKSGNDLTINRLVDVDFASGDSVDSATTFDNTLKPYGGISYVAEETTTTAVATLDKTASTLIGFPYSSDGSDLLFRINLRYTPGWSIDQTFINSQLQEIELHDTDDNDSHYDIRAVIVEQMVRINKEMRDIDTRINGIVLSNLLQDPNNVQ